MINKSQSYFTLLSVSIFYTDIASATAFTDFPATSDPYHIMTEMVQKQRDLELLHQHQQDFYINNTPMDITNQLANSSLQTTPSTTNPNWTPDTDAPCFKLQYISLTTGNLNDPASQSIDEKSFYPILNPLLDSTKSTYALNRCLNSHNLSLISHIAHNELLKLGFLTSSISIPEQDISTGKLILSIDIGKVNEILTHKKDGEQITNNRFIRQALPIKSGQALRLSDLEQGVDNLKKIDDKAQIQIIPAASINQLGFSDLQVIMNRIKSSGMDFMIDDSLSRTDGKYLTSLSLKANNLMHLNDEWVLTANYPLKRLISSTKGDTLTHLDNDKQLNYQAGLSFYQGFYKFGITHGVSEYERFVAGFHAPLRYHGHSKTLTINLNRLLHRDATHKTEGYIKAHHKNSRHFIDDIEIEVQRRRTTGWSAGIIHQQYFDDNAYLYANLEYRRGTGALKAQPAPEESIYNAFGQQMPAEGYARAPIWTWYLHYQKPMQLNSPKQYPIHLTHNIKSRGQYAKQLPTSQDKYYLGGRDSMKGTKEGIYISGEHGANISYELSYQLPYHNKRHNGFLYINFSKGMVWNSNVDKTQHHMAAAAIGIRHSHQSSSGWQVYSDIFIGKPLSTPNFIQKQTTTGLSIGITF